jgi:hypothetical protein
VAHWYSFIPGLLDLQKVLGVVLAVFFAVFIEQLFIATPPGLLAGFDPAGLSNRHHRWLSKYSW